MKIMTDNSLFIGQEGCITWFAGRSCCLYGMAGIEAYYASCPDFKTGARYGVG
jgi:hypothetical protein